MSTRCLVTGATGYIGGRLAPALLEDGRDVRVLAREPARLRDVPWADMTEVVRGDVIDADSVVAAMHGVDAAYYLVHAMSGGPGFADRDRIAAETFRDAARAAGVSRVVYLGGLAPRTGALSPHLRSREEVADLLLDSETTTVVLRAAAILGSGSASFEMLRYLTERLPAMVTPRWVRNRLQPIAVRDVLRYLRAAADLPSVVHGAYDVGGPDVVTYAELMQRYARAAGLRRRVLVPVPVLSPRLSSYWVDLVTPVPAALARPLVESLRHEMICGDDDIRRWIPDPPRGLLGVDEALQLALDKVRDAAVETRWSSAAWPPARTGVAPSDPMPTDPTWAGGSVYVDEREARVKADKADLWAIVEGIGGANGWYSFPLAWSARGLLDRLVGGVGLRRGRRDPERLRVGDSVDFWRVEELEPGTVLRLRAEMRLPGRAWLELRVGGEDGAATYGQRAVFVPRGLAGHVYWWVVAPFHGFVFGGMRRNIAAAAERRAA
jgi:uncharacterized protein YbjT (DUF2867 family)